MTVVLCLQALGTCRYLTRFTINIHLLIFMFITQKEGDLRLIRHFPYEFKMAYGKCVYTRNMAV